MMTHAKKHNIYSPWIFGLFVGIASFAAGSWATLETVQTENRIDILVDGRLFTSYRCPTDWKFPYLWPVMGPGSEKTLTIEKGIRYPHHRSLYFACDRVNGTDYWHGSLDARIVSEGPQIVESGTRVVLVDTCRWVAEGKTSPIRDRRTILIEARSPKVRFIEFRIRLDFLHETHIEKTNHSLFSAEVVPDLSVEGGGHLLNANGETGEEGTFGKKAKWCDYYGERDGITEGIAICQHPDNPGYPWPFFTRDYGFFSPTPLYWIDDEGLTFDAGNQLDLKFLVIVHQGSPEEAGMESLFSRWVRGTLFSEASY